MKGKVNLLTIENDNTTWPVAVKFNDVVVGHVEKDGTISFINKEAYENVMSISQTPVFASARYIGVVDEDEITEHTLKEINILDIEN